MKKALLEESQEIKARCDHLGSCLIKGTASALAETDKAFFDLLDKQRLIKRQIDRQKALR